jgi:hypothetical protein
MNLIELYKSILKFTGVEVDKDGYAFAEMENRREPILINGSRLALPTYEQLCDQNNKDKVIFHPLSEVILHGKSEVIEKLNSLINIRLNYTFGVIAHSLLNLAASPEFHSSLTSEQSELLYTIKEADETAVKNFVTMMVNGIKADAENVFVKIFLRRRANVRGKQFSRAGIVSFNMFEQLDTEETKILGVKLRKKDKETITALYKFMMPNIDIKETYNRGSDSMVAPFLDSLMQTAMAVASNLNDLLVNYKDHIDGAEKLMFDADWVETFENLEVMTTEIRRIPTQKGNEGKSATGTKPQATATAPAPYVDPVPQVQQPTQYQPPAPQHYQPPMQQPVYQAQPPAAPALVYTDKGIDFNSIVNLNRTVSHAPVQQMPTPFGNPQQQQQYNPQLAQIVSRANSVPSFAAPDPRYMGNQGMYQSPQYQQPQYQPQYQQPQQFQQSPSMQNINSAQL